MRVVGPQADRVRADGGRAAVVAGGGGAPTGRPSCSTATGVWSKRSPCTAGRRRSRRCSIVTEADEEDLLADLRALVARRRRVRGQRRPVLVHPRPRRRRHRRTSSSDASGGDSTSAASRRCARRRCSITRRWPATPREPTATTRCRRSPGKRRQSLPAEGAHVLRAAPGRRGPGRGAERPRAAGRRHGGGVAARLRAPRRSRRRSRWLKVAVEVPRPHRGDALRRPAAHRARRVRRGSSRRCATSRSWLSRSTTSSCVAWRERRSRSCT